ncbi:branched-chain amino acid ABC transporter permease [Streptomyces antibioticus]|uniref:ABC transporter permease n=1 Tax=Streptomyces antibioticus TaxID=1890 RepID=A0AAE6Y7Z2_STRAT|nr:branched-chain amino acid ABC transporter permease [Streptomyces antibioticus]MBO7934394.1 branched-chain amino acid ABC transporter permease [Streptomyces sp. S9]MCX4739813.1 branched-chain amino acid ABC transporter permease [Streptomyces antibioticus]MCX5168403.1 branched-chain amino acid ABC transporter permease [Streptomyces antibioticus]OOQ52775.1 ABC transporter permease [Streptomyces antibioticus]QIT43929.1 branched-chain amino acid ABC transporter permease [Streptomyces antibioticu
MNELPQQLVNGLLLGSMYGLVAIGYTMVYGIVQLINFAHGEIFMTGAFGALSVYLWVVPNGTTMWIALPLMLIGAMLVAALVAIGAERFAYRPLRGAPRLAPLITAIGLSLALQQAVWAWYPEAKSARTFPQIEGGPFHIGNVTIQTGDIFLLAAAPISMAVLAYFVMKTRTGRGMQATAQDPDTAKLMGVNTDRIIVIAFALGAIFAAVGGVAYGLKYGQIDYRMGFILGLKAFTAAVLGGIGNIYGAMIGGVVLGIAETLATAYIADIPGMDKFGSQSWADVWAFVLLILVLLFRPQGLLGERVADRA